MTSHRETNRKKSGKVINTGAGFEELMADHRVCMTREELLRAREGEELPPSPITPRRIVAHRLA